MYELAVYNGNYLETAPDGSDRFVSVSVQLDPDSSVPSLFDMRREIAHLINERCTAGVRSRVHEYLDIFCDEQLRAAYGQRPKVPNRNQVLCFLSMAPNGEFLWIYKNRHQRHQRYIDGGRA